MKPKKRSSGPKLAENDSDVLGKIPLFNRELSWLEFNRHVLAEATDDSLPILERLKFLSIFSTNLDEFFMIRISGLKEQIAANVCELSPDGMTAAEQLTEVRRRLRPLLKYQVTYLDEKILPDLKDAGISIEPYGQLSSAEKKRLNKYFHDNLFPILTPQSVDSSHPFPYVSNLSLNLGLFIEPDHEFTRESLKHLYRRKRFTRIQLPSSVPRLIPISVRKGRYVLLEEVVVANAMKLFPGMKASDAYLFRVTRDADIELREDEAGDLMRTLETELLRRDDRFAVRIEVSAEMPNKMVRILTQGVGLTEDDVESVDGFIGIPDLMQLYVLDKPRSKFAPISIVVPTPLRQSDSMFDIIRRQDVLLHHPYTSFSSVTDFIGAAADDPNVEAIKICLYRTGKDSPIVDSLIRASRQGKAVTALVELKARFDEENNIEWARRLENEGVHVVYGISALKTHAKILLVVRRERDKLVRYVHLATGNYNPFTARFYTDLGILTANKEIGADVADLFNFLTGYSQQSEYKRLSVAPLNLRDNLIALIRRESKNKRAKKEARIIVKANSITDVSIISELYAASQAGVEIDLIIRGICSLRPGIAGLSENIRVRAIIGRFLEHGRIFYFANGGEGNEKIYIGSADLMHRNLDRRVEVLMPILSSDIKKYLKDIVLPAYLSDSVNARVLSSDGTYKRIANRESRGFDSQMSFVGLDTSL